MGSQKIVVRPATQADTAAIHELNREGLGYDYDLQKTALRIGEVLEDSGNRLLIAELDGKVVGYIHGGVYTCTYSDPLKNILALVVSEDSRGRGAGRALLQALEAWAREDGAVGVRLVSGVDRTGAHRFYEACGYHVRKEQKNFIRYLA